jgi:hypothetical protein
VLGSDPQITRTVFTERGDSIVAEAVGIVGFVTVVRELASVGVELTDTTGECADP